MSTEAFSETLQFITNVKLSELDKRNKSFADHASKVVADAKVLGDTDPVARLSVLIEGMNGWPGAWSANVSVEDMKRWLEQAKRDPGFPRPVLQQWISKAEAEIEHERTRYDYARLFGNLLTDWLKSKSAVPQSVAAGESEEMPGQDGFEKVSRKETLEQKEKLESLIFTAKEVDVTALEAYLEDLFSSKAANEALEDMRKRIKRFAENLRKQTITSDELVKVISSVLRTDVLSEEKQATLKEFMRNSTVVKELASVLNMQLASLHAWSWPKEGVLLEPRRHLNGKTRFYLDTEILTCLLLHYLGTKWSVEFRQALEVLRSSRAWKAPARTLTRVDHRRRDAFFDEDEMDQMNIDKLRRQYQKDNFFMCQLPTSLDSAVDHYGDNDDESPRKRRRIKCFNPTSNLEPRFDTPVALKQSLLHILAADIVLDKALHGSCTIVRTDLEWFGPSLPHQTISTVLKFFGLPDEENRFIQSFLSCPIVFKDDPSGLVRTRKRGVPISYMLSTLCGELSLFVMDFAVNQRAEGLFLHRIHDDFWFWNWRDRLCAAAWKEMNEFTKVAGLTFNAEKTGSVCVGEGMKQHKDLPRGDVRWGFLKMDDNGKFVIDQAMIDQHIVELRRQLDATTSVFGWTQAYNKYMAFIVRNCGEPAIVYGKAHVNGIIDTLARIQRSLFASDSNDRGSFVTTIARMLETKFGVQPAEVPFGFYVWPNAAGGLEVRDPLVDLFILRDGCKHTPEEIFARAVKEDERRYAEAKQEWENGESSRLGGSWSESNVVSAGDPFFEFEEFVKGREERAPWWWVLYQELLRKPMQCTVKATPELEASLKVLGQGIEAFGSEQGLGWRGLSPYWQWLIGLHHDEMVKKFGSLAIVESTSVPVGMVSVFKGSRMKWEQ